MKRLLALMLWAVSLGVTAQGEYSLTVEEYAVDGIPGHTTYRVYVNVVNDDDVVAAVYGSSEHPLSIVADSGWYNNSLNSSWNVANLNPAFYSAFPEMQYDSFVTIGNDNYFGVDLIEATGGIDWRQEFVGSGVLEDHTFGSSFTIDDETGSTWFTRVTGNNNDYDQIADGRILLMQITTTGLLCGQLNIQLFSSGQPTLTVDVDGDGYGTLSDLLDILGVYGLPDSFVPTVNELLDTWTNENDLRCHASFCGTGTFIMTIEGCTDPTACNFDAYANVDDGSCDFESCLIVGCTDQIACNYDPLAELANNDTCTYAVDFYPSGLYDCDGNCYVDADADGVCDDVDDCVGELDACGICNGPGAIYECGCADIPEGDCDCDGNTVDVLGVCGGSCTSDHDNNGVCDDQEVFGCAYPLADNYSPEVTHDDGSCVFPCVGEVNANVFDWDGDYSVTVTDFLMMLTVFGDVDVDFDGVWDSADECIDIEACNYDADPSEPCQYIDVLGICGGGCPEDADADGVCDDVDDCIGVVDECGVCNGPGATEVVIEDITILYDSVYAEQIDTWFVFEVGADTAFTYTCAPFFNSCGDPFSYQGYDYETVQIGEQCWFAENLRAEYYRNGDHLLGHLSNSEWGSTVQVGAMAIYGEGDGFCSHKSPDGDACDVSWSLNAYGRLYNAYAVDDERGLCPNGWHVPAGEEWTVLTDFLGGDSIAGEKMKATYGWAYDGNGSDEVGFSGLPGGGRLQNSYYFAGAGGAGRWWEGDGSMVLRCSRSIWYDSPNVERYCSNSPKNGFSVRCIKDSE